MPGTRVDQTDLIVVVLDVARVEYHSVLNAEQSAKGMFWAYSIKIFNAQSWILFIACKPDPSRDPKIRPRRSNPN